MFQVIDSVKFTVKEFRTSVSIFFPDTVYKFAVLYKPIVYPTSFSVSIGLYEFVDRQLRSNAACLLI